MRDHIDVFIQKTLLIQETAELKLYFADFMSAFGFDLIAYHYLAEGFKKLTMEKGFRISKFPESFIKLYLSKGAFDYDPLMEETRRRSVPFHWFDVAERTDLSDAQRDFFNVMREIGVKDGIAIPVYARPGDIAYFSLGSTLTKIGLSKAQMIEIQAICQHMHLRYNELTKTAAPPKLSHRELQVLELIVQGKSNSVMGNLLGVSPNTIDTLVRRCFEKLGVSSRLEAALAGVAMGLILH